MMGRSPTAVDTPGELIDQVHVLRRKNEVADAKKKGYVHHSRARRDPLQSKKAQMAQMQALLLWQTGLWEVFSQFSISYVDVGEVANVDRCHADKGLQSQ